MTSLIGNPRVNLETVDILNKHYWAKFSKMGPLCGTDFANICKYLRVLRYQPKIGFFQGSWTYKVQVLSSGLCK